MIQFHFKKGHKEDKDTIQWQKDQYKKRILHNIYAPKIQASKYIK